MGYYVDDFVCEKVMIIKILFIFSIVYYIVIVYIYDFCLYI